MADEAPSSDAGAELRALREGLQAAQAQLSAAKQREADLEAELRAMHTELQAVNAGLQRYLSGARGLGEGGAGLLHALPVGVVVLENDDRICHSNPRAFDLFEPDVAHLESLKKQSLGLLENRLSTLDLVAAVARVRGTGVALSRVASTKSGRALSLVITPLFAADEVLRVVITWVDVTERERLKVYETLATKSGSLAAVLDPTGSVLDANPAFLDAIGRPRTMVVGGSFRSLLHPQSGATLETFLSGSCSKKSWSGALVFRHASGGDVPATGQLLAPEAHSSTMVRGFLADR